MTDGTVAVFPGNGNGTFNTATVTTVGGGSFSGAGSMAAGDFDSDGTTDLAVATTGDGEMRILLGNGTGGFASSALTVGDQGYSVATCDYNTDGDLDLVFASGDYLNMFVYYLLTGNGSGGFASTSSILGSDAGSGGQAIAVGDYYGDGTLALAYAHYSSASLSIVPIDGSGVWGQETLYPWINGLANQSFYSPANLISADLNADGRDDLGGIAGDAYDGYKLYLLLSDPNSNQMEPVQRIGLSGPALLAAAPFTGRANSAHYAAPMGDTSVLTRNISGTWTRTYTDGTVLHFDSSGRQNSEVDRNGNTTAYGYIAGGAAAGALHTVTDPVGLMTTLVYDGSGHIRTITDPAGRVTTFTIDSYGNLTQIVDPDGAVTQFGYSTPSNHRLTTEVSPNGHTATAHYDSFGRLSSETLFDGTSATSVVPAEVRGLLAAGGSGPLLRPSSFGGVLTDANGHATTVTFDNMGHPIASVDANGQSSSTIRNMNGWALSSTDPLYRTTSFAYDAKGNVTKVTRPDASYLTIAYDPTFSVPTRITDYRGLTTTFSLDSHGNVTRRTDPDLLHEDFTYNPAGQILTDTDRAGRTTTLTYDSLGRLTTVAYPGPGSPTVGIGYNAAGDITSVTDELGHATTMTYDLAGRLLTTKNPVQAAASAATALAYDADGNLLSATDALGHVTSFAYDARDRLVGMTDASNQGTGHQTTYTYDPVGYLRSVIDPLGHATTYGYDAKDRITSVTDALGHSTTYNYDSADQLVGMTDRNGNATTYTYDNLGRVQSTTRPGGDTYTYGYDPNGNRTSLTDPLYHTTGWAYDDLNRPIAVTDALWNTTSFGYDAVGNRASVTDPLGHVTSYTYDDRDRLVSQAEPSGGGTTTFAYDLAGRLASVTDPVNNVTSYTYDAANRPAIEISPTGGVTTYTYDLVDNLIQKVDPLGRIVQYGHDADDRRTIEEWLPVGGGSAFYTMTMTYDIAGRITDVRDNNSHYAYGLDAVGRVTSIDNAGTASLPQVTQTYDYDANGNRTEQADSLGGIVGYEYDARDRLVGESQSGTGVAEVVARFGYDAAGRLTALTRYSDLSATTEVVRSLYGYDDADRLTSLAHQRANSTTIASYGYTLDAASRLTQEARTWATTSGTVSDTVSYGYTDNDQLTSVTHTSSLFAAESFSYDNNGNRDATGQATTTGNRLSSDGTYNYAYDAAGNLVSRTEISTGDAMIYEWDYRNRLIRVDHVSSATTTVVASYTYDAVNRLIGVVEGATTRRTLYDGQTPLFDFDGTGALTARYLSVPGAIDELLARQTVDGVAWYLSDRLGTVRDITDGSGSVIDHIDYNVYGGVTSETNPGDGDRFKFAGMELDTATSLYYDRARFYDSNAGRFISQDPIGFRGNSLNLYSYVNNKPNMEVDPLGFCPATPDDRIRDDIPPDISEITGASVGIGGNFIDMINGLSDAQYKFLDKMKEAMIKSLQEILDKNKGLSERDNKNIAKEIELLKAMKISKDALAGRDHPAELFIRKKTLYINIKYMKYKTFCGSEQISLMMLHESIHITGWIHPTPEDSKLGNDLADDFYNLIKGTDAWKKYLESLGGDTSFPL